MLLLASAIISAILLGSWKHDDKCRSDAEELGEDMVRDTEHGKEAHGVDGVATATGGTAASTWAGAHEVRARKNTSRNGMQSSTEQDCGHAP